MSTTKDKRYQAGQDGSTGTSKEGRGGKGHPYFKMRDENFQIPGQDNSGKAPQGRTPEDFELGFGKNRFGENSLFTKTPAVEGQGASSIAMSRDTGISSLTQENSVAQSEGKQMVQVPSVSVPQGGGALTGIEETYNVNTARGTASFGVPLPLTSGAHSGRQVLTPSVELSYDSGGGNSVFGHGWNLSYPMIQRRTNKAIPSYIDDKDIFVFQGEELIPVLVPDDKPCLIPSVTNNATKIKQEVRGDLILRYYRPRTESGFSEIIHVQSTKKVEDETSDARHDCDDDKPDNHQANASRCWWVVRSADDVTTIYGMDEQSCITHPTEAHKVYAWMAHFSFDGLGNWVRYEYKSEDLVGVDCTLNERHRFNTDKELDRQVFSQQYLKRVCYGNTKAWYADSVLNPTLPEADADYHYEAIWDYGEHGAYGRDKSPQVEQQQQDYCDESAEQKAKRIEKERQRRLRGIKPVQYDEADYLPTLEERYNWLSRPDAYSNNRSGFEMRTYRRCHQVLMFHHYEGKQERSGREFGRGYLVRSLRCYYTPSSVNGSGQSETSYLSKLVQFGHVRDGEGKLQSESLPALEFDYQPHLWDTRVHKVSAKELGHAATAERFQWVDLHGEGIAGLLSEQGDAWWYQPNLGVDESLASAEAKILAKAYGQDQDQVQGHHQQSSHKKMLHKKMVYARQTQHGQAKDEMGSHGSDEVCLMEREGSDGDTSCYSSSQPGQSGKAGSHASKDSHHHKNSSTHASRNESGHNSIYPADCHPEQIENRNNPVKKLKLDRIQNLARIPSLKGYGQQIVLQDLESDGRRQLVVSGRNGGYYSVEENTAITYLRSGLRFVLSPFSPFLFQPTIELNSEQTRLLDLDGDGRAELVMTEERALVWHRSEGSNGYGKARRSTFPYQARGTEQDVRGDNSVVFADKEGKVFIADMTGDGLQDIVRIRNGEISYWANQGHGRFSPRIQMANAPRFTHDEHFNPAHLRLADISGTGTADILYFNHKGIQVALNLSGNGYGDISHINTLIAHHPQRDISVTDLLGSGTACLVWRSSLPDDATAPMRYIDLMASKVPHVMKGYRNKLGKEVKMRYRSSTVDYLRAKRNGHPWRTKLPNAVQVIAKSMTIDHITGSRYTTDYAYHHGYYDFREREFRGFGRVDTIDSEDYVVAPQREAGNESDEQASKVAQARSKQPYSSPARIGQQAPVLSRTWFHTGWYQGVNSRGEFNSHPFENEYWYRRLRNQISLKKDELKTSPWAWVEHYREPTLCAHHFDLTAVNRGRAKFLNANLYFEEIAQGLRACQGRTLRQEIFALDGGAHWQCALAQTDFGHLLQQVDEAIQPRAFDPAYHLDRYNKGHKDKDKDKGKDNACDVGEEEDEKRDERHLAPLLRAAIPYQVTMSNHRVGVVQRIKGSQRKSELAGRYGSFVVSELETLILDYERNPEDARLSHTLNTQFDDYGQVLERAEVVYPRHAVKSWQVEGCFSSQNHSHGNTHGNSMGNGHNNRQARRGKTYPSSKSHHTSISSRFKSTHKVSPKAVAETSSAFLPEAVETAQARTLIRYSHYRHTDDIQTPEHYRLRTLSAMDAFELAGITKSAELYQRADFDGVLDKGSELIEGTDNDNSHDATADANGDANGDANNDENKDVNKNAAAKNSKNTEEANNHNTTYPTRRLLQASRTLYYDRHCSKALPFGKKAGHGRVYTHYLLSQTDKRIQRLYGNVPGDVFGDTSADNQTNANNEQSIWQQQGYVDIGRITSELSESLHGVIARKSSSKTSPFTTSWWVNSGRYVYHASRSSQPLKNIASNTVLGSSSLSKADSETDLPTRFYTPIQVRSSLEIDTHISYQDEGYLFIREIVDALGNSSTVLRYNYRNLGPDKTRDENHNVTEVAIDALGLPKAMALLGKEAAEGENAENGQQDASVNYPGDNLEQITDYTNEAERELTQKVFYPERITVQSEQGAKNSNEDSNENNNGDKNVIRLTDSEALMDASRALLQQATTRYIYDWKTAEASAETVKSYGSAQGEMHSDNHDETCNSEDISQNISHNNQHSHQHQYHGQSSQQPAVVATISREQHVGAQVSDKAIDNGMQNEGQEVGQKDNGQGIERDIETLSPLQIGYEYTDGLGQVAMQQRIAAPGIARHLNKDHLLESSVASSNKVGLLSQNVINIDTRSVGEKEQLRFLTSGRTVYNNKGNVIKQYEPYFTTNIGFIDESQMREYGVTAILTYDPLGRLVRTDFPDQSFSLQQFDAWQYRFYDQNDTAKLSGWYSKRMGLDFISSPRPETIETKLSGIDQVDTADMDHNLEDELRDEWHAQINQNANISITDLEAFAAEQTDSHYNTPAILHLDTLARPIARVLTHQDVSTNKGKSTYRSSSKQSSNKIANGENKQPDVTLFHMDIESRVSSVIDARGNQIISYDYDYLGQRLKTSHADAGSRWHLQNGEGKPFRFIDGKQRVHDISYDVLQRPLTFKVTQPNDSNKPSTMVYERMVYGEGQGVALEKNLNGKLVERYDSTGLTRYHDYDFKGNNLSSSRYFSQDPKAELDWSADHMEPDDDQEFDAVNIGFLGDDSFDDGALTTQGDSAEALAAKELAEKELTEIHGQYLEANAYTSHYEYDALNRVIKEINPDNSIIIRRYDETTWLRRVIAKTPININPLRPNTSKNSSKQGDNKDENNENDQGVVGQTNTLTKKIIVKNIHYNAKGQRTKIAYGNGSQTRYIYDENTFRLIRQRTRGKARENVQESGQANLKVNGHESERGKLLQDLNYTHDAVGNIVAIKDKAVPTRFFANQKIEALSRYYYDARYRLVKATGIEHRGQNAANNNINSHSQDPSSRAHGGDGFYIKRYQANDPMAWRNYTQQYQYDEVGNITQMRHIADQANWIRDYSYAEDSNRLLSTSDNTGSFRPLKLQYGYDDAHGYMTQLPHLSQMDYNFKDELIATSRQQVNEQVNEDIESNVERIQERTVYQYDASGMRIRKICYGQNGQIKYERRYLGSTEEYYQDSGQYAGLVRHSLHINDGEQRVALYEQRNEIDDDSPVQTMRYQIANHQPSSTLELDDEANLISYEIYHPFGTTAYQANNKDIKAAAKRYRYSGKERDEETGLYYFGARYYMPWLGRWTSCDPIVFSEGQYAEAELNGYQYVDNDPVGGVDPNGEAGETYENREAGGNAYGPVEISEGALDRLSYEGKSTVGKVGVFAANATTSIIKAGIDTLSYAGTVATSESPLQKLAEDASAVGEGIYNYATETSLEEFGSDLKDLATNIETWENLAGGLATGGAGLAVKTARSGAKAAARNSGRTVDGNNGGGENSLESNRRLNSSNALEGVEPASQSLIDAVSSKRDVNFVTEGSEELRYLDAIGAEANVGGTNMDHILLRQNPSKAAVLEEFLHGTQQKLGIIDNLGIAGAEKHVKSFMIRHQKMLGLGAEDVSRLQKLMDAGL